MPVFSTRLRFAVVIVLLFLTAACVPKFYGPNYDVCGDYSKDTTPVLPLAPRLNDGRHRQKAAHLLILLDDTLSMQDCLGKTSKRRAAINLVHRMNRTLAGVDLAKGLRIFSVNADRDDLDHDIAYAISRQPNRKINPVVVNTTPDDTIFNPVAMALDSAYLELKGMSGGTAVVVVSDFSHTDAALSESAASLQRLYGDDVCVYPVPLGADADGLKAARRTASAAGCGWVVEAGGLAAPKAMTDFLDSILFVHEAPPAPLPPFTTPSYERLKREHELRVNLRVQFDFDKAVIKPQYESQLQTIGRFMTDHPDVTTVIEGHTCNIGTEKYNLRLSLRRAMAIKTYLVDHFGIAPARLGVAAYGESRPIADNSTEEGRIKNRRAVAVLRTMVSGQEDSK